VYLFLGGKGEGLRNTYCKVKLGKLIHKLSMVRIGKEKKLRHDYWK
jgi:hypothetical protein